MFKSPIVKIIIGSVLSLIALLFIADAVINSGNAIVICILLVVGVAFLVYGIKTRKGTNKVSAFRKWYGEE